MDESERVAMFQDEIERLIDDGVRITDEPEYDEWREAAMQTLATFLGAQHPLRISFNQAGHRRTGPVRLAPVRYRHPRDPGPDVEQLVESKIKVLRQVHRLAPTLIDERDAAPTAPSPGPHVTVHANPTATANPTAIAVSSSSVGIEARWTTAFDACDRTDDPEAARRLLEEIREALEGTEPVEGFREKF